MADNASSFVIRRAEVALPASSPLLQAFVQAGYKPEDEGGTAFYIYELDLKGAAL